ncbi:MAG: AAA family ATPase, partial [Okeania sp. SIO3C4]|nr:AAA family ATPase [Okeania sp. SIO3C4]
MRLHSVKIKRLRSIEEVELKDCGDFNVLIGKNNSGKSSILLAINTFFKCIKDGNIITLNPTIEKEIDFFNKETNSPIEIIIVFGLDRDDKDVLINEIIHTAPQMKNAVGNIEFAQQLLITLKIAPPPRTYSLVTQMKLVNNYMNDINLDQGSFILTIDDSAAKELYNKSLKYSQQVKDTKKLDRITSKIDMSPRLLRDWKSEDDIPISYFFRDFFVGNQINSDIVSEIENIYEESQSYEQFIKSTKAIADRIKEEAKKNLEKPLLNKIDTFTGEENLIPNYAKHILERVSKLKVTHLIEQRQSIGKEDAERLLLLKMRRGGEQNLSNIKDTVLSLLGVKIDAFQAEFKTLEKAELNAELDVDDFLVEVNGSGIREALRLVLDFEFEQPNILLIEEPEIHLHPALEISMMRYLKRISSRCQIILTTHSTNFLDTGEMQNVYLVSKPDSTQIQKLDIQEAETKIPQELGIRLSSLFMFDRLVFVEGKSDEDVIREWASKLGVNFSQANVGFVIIG